MTGRKLLFVFVGFVLSLLLYGCLKNQLDARPGKEDTTGMQIVIHQWAFEGDFDQLESTPRQELTHDWFGEDVSPAVEFSFATDGKSLWFLAAHAEAKVSHPEGSPNKFQSELWKYDVAEWFMADLASDRYWEFNLDAQGAWWASAFCSTRKPDDKMPAPQGVKTATKCVDGTWITMAQVPLTLLSGVDLRSCKLAATFILRTPNQIFLTTADNLVGEPDFHRPSDWATPLLK